MRSWNLITLALTLSLLSACGADKDPAPAAQAEAERPSMPPAAAAADRAVSQTPAGGELQANSSSLHGNVQNLHMQVNLAADAMFDFDSAVLKETAAPELRKAAEAIRASGKSNVTITGHTDAKGNDAYNRKLSLDRATAVRDWLVANGIEQTFTVSGQGASQPIAPNANADGSDNPEGRAKNRRVEININGSRTLGG